MSTTPLVARPLRVAVIDHVAQRSGGQLAMERLAGALSDRVSFCFVLGTDGPLVDSLRAAGHEVRVMELGAVKDERIADIRPLRTTAKYLRPMARNTRHLARFLREGEFDAVYTNSLKAHVYGGVASRLARVPWVAHVRDILAPPYLPSPLAHAVKTALLTLRPSAIIANSPATKAVLPLSARVTVVPSGVPVTPRVRPTPDGPLTLGLLGRLVEWKGQDVALRALQRIASTIPDVRLRIGGDAAHGSDRYAAELRELAKELGVADRVEFAGFQTDPFTFFERCHVALHTSVLPEPFGQVVVEALAVGRPVVAANAGGPAEILGMEAGGLLVAPGDAAALAAAVTAIASDPRRYASLQAAAITRASDYSLSDSAVKTLGVLKNASARRPLQNVRQAHDVVASAPHG